MKWSSLLGLLGLASCTQQTPPPPTRTDGLSPIQELHARANQAPELAVLFVGNSYSFGLPKALTKEAAAHGRKIRTGHSTYGGWSLLRHAKNEPTLRKIREGKWDIVVIQEQSRIPSLPARQRKHAMLPPLRELVAAVRAAGAIPVLYQTWGRLNGDAETPRDTFLAMNARLREGYRIASENTQDVVIVPVGDAWEKVYRAGHGAELYLEDGSHPSAKGTELTARVFHHTFFGSSR